VGNFYTNITLQGPEQDQIADYLRETGRAAFVSPTQKGLTLVFDALGDSQDTEVLADISAKLSARFRCPALVVLNHDDDILWYQLHQDGQLKDEYNSAPDYFGASASSEPTGGDAAALCAAFGVPDVADRVESILREDYLFALERHQDLTDALGLPDLAIGGGYRYIESGDAPPGLEQSRLIRTGG